MFPDYTATREKSENMKQSRMIRTHLPNWNAVIYPAGYYCFFSYIVRINSAALKLLISLDY